MSMMIRLVVLIPTMAGLVTLPAEGQAKKRKERAPNPAYAEITDDPALPRVLLIGDSISIGYTLPTRELLEGKA